MPRKLSIELTSHNTSHNTRHGDVRVIIRSDLTNTCREAKLKHKGILAEIYAFDDIISWLKSHRDVLIDDAVNNSERVNQPAIPEDEHAPY